MPKPTQAEVAELIVRLRADGPIAGAGALLDEAADAIEALAGEGAEPVANTVLRNLAAEVGSVVGLFEPELRQLAGNTNVACLKRRLDEADAYLNAAPPAKPAGELPPLPEHTAIYLSHYTGKNLWQWNQRLSRPPTDTQTALYTAADMRAYALRALRERA